MRGRRETRADLSAQRDQPRLETAAAYLDHEHRAGRGPPPLGRATGIEEPDPLDALGLRKVRVPVDDGVGARKASRQTRLAPDPRARHVQHPDSRLLDIDDAAFREQAAQLRLVGVALDGRQRRPERLQLLKGRDTRDVAGVEDQVRAAQELDTAVGQPARSARQVRVGDNDDARQPTPFKNRPSR